jgi:hypothetical protein
MILQQRLTTEDICRQSVCRGTSCRKSLNLELKMVKKHTETMLARKAMVKSQFLYFHSGFISTIKYIKVIYGS